MLLRNRAINLPAPFSWSPSQVFEGNDGSWSTFVVRIGSPDQDFNILPSTAGQETWVPISEGCLPTDPSDCGTLRGVLPFDSAYSGGFQVNQSSTWVPINLYELGLEQNLNISGNGEYGFDTVGLELPGSGGLTLNHSIVAGVPDKDFFLGVFGLGPKPTNFTDGFNDPQPSFMWTLKNQSMIPSLSYGYTAGAPYRLKKVLGSLTLGGYDAGRFVPNDQNFAFSADDSRVLTVGVQTIMATNTLGGVMSLLPQGILSLIDSTVPEIWLPESACMIFEQAFGLQFDPHTNLYLVNDTIHSRLRDLNPSITFKLGNTASGGSTINIELPYNAFDLQASWPIYTNATNYFPLRRAANDSQYTLGRTFLQEAYVIADYERSNFTVSQCLFSENSTSRIVAIRPFSTSESGSSISKGALIGIIVASIVALLLILTGAYIYFQFKKKKTTAARAQRERDELARMIAEGQGQNQQMDEVHGLYEAYSPPQAKIHRFSELQGTKLGHELQGAEVRAELHDMGRVDAVELSAGEVETDRLHET